MDAHRFSTAADALAFILAGNATLTLVSKKTGARFTYRVRVLRDRATGKPAGAGPHFVSVLTGSSNESDYSFLGTIFTTWREDRPSRPAFIPGTAPKCRIAVTAPSARAFAWTMEHLVGGDMPESLEVWHEGRCGKCGRKLTTPESVANGIGPVCEESAA